MIWQLGILSLLGYGIDPMNILTPFLIFAIGVSHGVQMISGWTAEKLFGGHSAASLHRRSEGHDEYGIASSLDAAKATFSRLLAPGSIALLSDTIGFPGHLSDQHPDHPGACADRQHRRGGHHLHQPAADAGTALLRPDPQRRGLPREALQQSVSNVLDLAPAGNVHPPGAGACDGRGCRVPVRWRGLQVAGHEDRRLRGRRTRAAC